jgi:hypothetical protein
MNSDTDKPDSFIIKILIGIQDFLVSTDKKIKSFTTKLLMTETPFLTTTIFGWIIILLFWILAAAMRMFNFPEESAVDFVEICCGKFCNLIVSAIIIPFIALTWANNQDIYNKKSKICTETAESVAIQMWNMFKLYWPMIVYLFFYLLIFMPLFLFSVYSKAGHEDNDGMHPFYKGLLIALTVVFIILGLLKNLSNFFLEQKSIKERVFDKEHHATGTNIYNFGMSLIPKSKDEASNTGSVINGHIKNIFNIFTGSNIITASIGSIILVFSFDFIPKFAFKDIFNNLKKNSENMRNLFLFLIMLLLIGGLLLFIQFHHIYRKVIPGFVSARDVIAKIFLPKTYKKLQNEKNMKQNVLNAFNKYNYKNN